MNTNKFDSKGNVYSKARPNYPEELFMYLLSKGIIGKEQEVADIGSGTGIFTVQISPFVKTVFAVEPNDDMSAKAKDKFNSFSNIISITATAESTSLPDSSVDLITVAQAFHWFDRESFQKECQRILRPKGKVVLVWNDRDISAEIIKDNFEINKHYCPNFKGSSNGIDFAKDGFKDFFDEDFELIEFNNTVYYNLETFISRNLSSSYAPKETDDAYSEYIKAISQLFEKHSDGKTLEYPYITRCYIGKV